MKIDSAYLKENLKHVYWLNGGACAGKSTMTQLFTDKLGFQTVRDDVLKYRSYTTHQTHPAMQMPNPSLNWDEWFNRPTEVHSKWMLDIVEEMMEFFIIDLLKLPNDRPIIVDLGVRPEFILPFIPKERMIGLFTSDENVKQLYLFREDHKMILDCIKANTKVPEQTIINVSRSVVAFSNTIRNQCVDHEIKCIERTDDLTKEAQFNQICSYFQLGN